MIVIYLYTFTLTNPGHRVGIDRQFAGQLADRGHQIPGLQGPGRDGEDHLADDLFIDRQAVGRVDSEEHASVLCTSEIIQ